MANSIIPGIERPEGSLNIPVTTGIYEPAPTGVYTPQSTATMPQSTAQPINWAGSNFDMGATTSPTTSGSSFSFDTTGNTVTPTYVDPSMAPGYVAPTGAQGTTSPTIAESLAAAQLQAQQIQAGINALPEDKQFVSGSFDQGTTTEPFDEERARREALRNQLRLHQAEIDATNQIYDEQLNQARLEGAGRLGSTRAIGARGGILGSDFGASQKQAQIGANTAQQRAIGAERAAKIGNIMGNVRQSVLDEMTAKREAYTLGADAVLANIAGQKDRRQNNIKQFAGDLIAQGMDISDLSEDELKEISKEAGVSVNDLVSGYARVKAAETTGDTKKYTLKAGETLVDGQTGEAIASVPGEDVVYKEGDVIKHSDGTTTKIGKTTAPKAGAGEGDGIYTSKNLPPEIKSEFINVYTANPDATLVDMTLTFPEIEAETLQQMYDDYVPEGPEEEGFDWSFWN